MTQAETRSSAVHMTLSVLRDGRRRDRYLRVGGAGYYLAGFYQATPFSDDPADASFVRIPVLEAADADDLHDLAERLVRKVDGVAA